MGEDVAGLDMEELRGLEQSLDESLKLVRNRKYHVISTQTDTYKKKLKNSHEAYRNLLHELEMRDEHSEYVYVSEGHNHYEEELALANGGSHLFSFQLQPNQPNLHGFRFNSHDLSLA
ncbi:hypothetical protein J5N97_019019 [Dioscorea zingiberensis]|uniref:K-box domain-containing protein n=1 Tax=Dioscorea zingiberensis TaxID=325984 RepID=A0A9D5CDY4_9LILI|nr:hypothetical protein J5N97_019019 [Dioscorea zingiberensis]